MSVKRWFRRKAPQWDTVDWITLMILGVIVAVGGLRLVSPSPSLPTPGHSLALLTAGSVFYAQYRLRHPNKGHVPAVRPEYKNPYSTDETGYGLKNYGPGPALYLQIKAKVSDGDKAVLLRPHDQPTHLEEGKFLSLTDDNQRGNNRTLVPLIEGAESGSELQFYYSYISQEGIREPLGAKKLTEQDDDDILSELPISKDMSEDARSIEIEQIRQHLEIGQQDRRSETRIGD